MPTIYGLIPGAAHDSDSQTGGSVGREDGRGRAQGFGRVAIIEKQLGIYDLKQFTPLESERK
jgi:hypothetical protein